MDDPRHFLQNRRANTTIMFALAVPAVFGAVAVGLDYSLAARMHTKMQGVADSAALASAREFQMSRADPTRISAVARSFVMARLPDVEMSSTINATNYSVQVVLEKEVEPVVGAIIGLGKVHLRASATARMSGGQSLCLLALDLTAKATIKLEKSARMTAPGCMVYSNSRHPEGMMSMDDAILQAGYICSAGGKVRTKNTNYTPEPMTDCPVIPDPLSARQGPGDFTCGYTNKVVDGTSATLQPGVYCGGLKIVNGAQVVLSPGIFVIKDGPLLVDTNAGLRGDNVALYMKGAGANLTFGTTSTITLTAPKNGSLAGILIFDDPSGAPAPELSGKHAKPGKSPREHSILSDNARTLLGTIYMPKGRLIIDATKPVADRSAYTVMVVHQLDLFEGPNLVLNSDYGASDIPPPQGVGPYGGTISLTN